MSHTAVLSPLPSCGRVTPRWSVAGQPVFVPASISGLPVRGAWVRAEPPLVASESSSGLVDEESVGSDSVHDESELRLFPEDVIAPSDAQLPVPPPLASTVFLSVRLPPLGT